MVPVIEATKAGWGSSYSTLPDAEEFAARRRRQNTRIIAISLVLSVLAGVLFTVMHLDSPLLPGLAALCIMTLVLVWHWPRTALWVTFACVCLIEMFQTPYKDALTDRIPFFWNVNTVFQVYAHANIKAVPVSLMEIFLFVAGVACFLKNLYQKTLVLRAGPLIVPFLVYMGFVLLGWANGMLTGGDFKISLQEVRSQFYFCIAYLMATNFIRNRQDVRILLWISILCIGLKGILYTFRRYVTLAGLPLPDQGVGSHEEAFLFDTLVVLLLNLALCSTDRKMRNTILILLPTTVLGFLACNRRAGIAALIILLPALLLAAYHALPRRRGWILATGITLGVGFSIYYPLYKNSDSMLALPARAVRSEFSPDARDAASNAYRDAENMCQMTTIKLSPVIGYGYGKRFLHAVPIADISRIYEWWDILPHNQILWVWMRVGTLGFIAFWMLIAAILVRACRLVRRDDLLPFDRAVVLQTLSLIVILLIFGLLDLQLSNYRDMIFVGIFAGVISCPLFPGDPDSPSTITGTLPLPNRAVANTERVSIVSAPVNLGDDAGATRERAWDPYENN